MDISVEISNRAESVNHIIEKYLPAVEGYQKLVLEAMNYSVQAGGKRLRPIMMQETYHMFGGTDKIVEPFMAAIEMIHTYSLVHDDLPAMDNDQYRRGKLTTHAKYGEDMGILTGDALLNFAFETVSEAFEMQPCNPNVAKAFRVLAKKAGIFGMVGGQVVDVESDKQDAQSFSRDKLDFIYRLKTGALIEASMMIGAILAGATDAQVSSLERIATNIGIAFQIQDDILDVTGSFEVLGKPIGSDEKNHKPTYVTYEGLEKASKDVERLTDEAVKALHELGKEDEFLQQLFLYLVHRVK